MLKKGKAFYRNEQRKINKLVKDVIWSNLSKPHKMPNQDPQKFKP